MYVLKVGPDDGSVADKSLGPKPVYGSSSCDDEGLPNKKIKSSSEDTGIVNLDTTEDKRENEVYSSPSTASCPDDSIGCSNYANTRPQNPDAENEAAIELLIIQLSKYEINRTFMHLPICIRDFSLSFGPITAESMRYKRWRTY